MTTTVLGFGCAGVFRLPTRRERHAVLEAAREAGIRHFDVAPMYGVGRAEAELAPLLTDDRDAMTITTKFGIEPSTIGRLVGRGQGPVRAVLARRPHLQSEVANSGRDAESGSLGRLLYRGKATPDAAERSLRRSLRAMATGYVDVYAVHEPRLVEPDVSDELADCLDRLRQDGLVRSWGLAGDLAAPDGPIAGLVTRAQVVQHRDDIFEPRPSAGGARITYGSLSRAMSVISSYLQRIPEGLTGWSERLQADLRDPPALAGLLLRQAIRRNPDGVVLFTTTRLQRVVLAAAAVSVTPVAGEEQALDELAAAACAQEPAERKQ